MPPATTTEKKTTQTIAIGLIRTDGGTQIREGIDPGTVAEYADAKRGGAVFPPVGLVYDGENYWMYDGFHRHAMHVDLGLTEIEAEVVPGTLRDAVRLGCGANITHGLRSTAADRRRAVLVMLKDPEWSQLSDREIARATGASHTNVGRIRRELNPGPAPEAEDAREPAQARTATPKAGPVASLARSTPRAQVEDVTDAAPARAPEPAGEVEEEDALGAMTIRAKLSDRCRAAFDHDARAYLGAVEMVARLRTYCKAAVRATPRDIRRGAWLNKMGWLLALGDPAQWIACLACEAGGVSTGVRDRNDCPECKGLGYHIPGVAS